MRAFNFYALLLGLTHGLNVLHSSVRSYSPRVTLPPRCCMPPPLKADLAEFQRGTLADGNAWWRQDAQIVQLVVALPEDASFRRDVSVDLSRKRISLTVQEAEVLVGDLAHDVVKDESDWFVEEDLDGFDGERFLVVEMRKHESYLDWGSPLMADGATTSERKILLGGKGESQKAATAQQLASYQILQKLPGAVRGDVYARDPAGGAAEDGEMVLYFIGKVIAETASAPAALATQEQLIREHARVYLPEVFGQSGDGVELWLAPGNTEMRVAQNEIGLTRWEWPPTITNIANLDKPPTSIMDTLAAPAAGAGGFEPETAPPEHMGGADVRFKVRRALDGQPLGGSAFTANVVKPDEVPGAYEAWMKDQ